MLAWKLSNTMDTSFCVAALEEAWVRDDRRYSTTDQGSQFTSEAFTQTLQEQRVRSAWMVRVGTWTTSSWSGLWRSIKYEEGYLKA